MRGDRRIYGALMLGVPSLAVNAWGISSYCKQSNVTPSGCTLGNVISAIFASGFNAMIGYLIGKGIPGLREIK